MSNLPATTDATFKNDTSKGGVVVDFWGDGWGACVRLAPVVEQVAGENRGVKFLQIDVHNNYDTASAFGIMSIPQLIFFKDGTEVARLVGAVPKGKIEEALKKVK